MKLVITGKLLLAILATNAATAIAVARA